jgi:hypothetical protein
MRSAVSRSFTPSLKPSTRCRHGISERAIRRASRVLGKVAEVLAIAVQQIEGEEHKLVVA